MAGRCGIPAGSVARGRCSHVSRAQIQFFLGAVCLAVLVIYLWRSRLYLNSHVDMLLIMFASGGLGMLLGMSSHMSHAADFVAWWPMCTGMFILGLAPAIAFSRCLRAARRHGYLLKALLIDSSAMLAGMWLSASVTIGHGEWMMISRYFTMLAGMMLGMIAGMGIRSIFLPPLRLQTRRELTNDTSEACVRAGRSR